VRMGKVKFLAARVIAAFEDLTVARFALATIVVVLLILHGLISSDFMVDDTSIALLVILFVTILVPVLDSATFPFGGGVKLNHEVDKFKKLSDAAATEGARSPLSASPPPTSPDQPESSPISEPLRQVAPLVTDAEDFSTIRQMEDSLDEEILRETARSPRLGLMFLSAELERAVRELLLTTGWATEDSQRSLRAGVNRLVQLNVLSKNAADAVSLFSTIRNQIVHGSRSIGDEEVLRVIDAALPLLTTVQAIPRERNFVYRANVPIFSDPDCQHLRENVFGLILATYRRDNSASEHRIYPTTRTDYQIGKEVTWEWNLALVWQDTWFRDPDTGIVDLAWSGSAEFVGRQLN